MMVMLANPAARERIDSGRERYFIKAGSRWPWSYVKRIGEPCRPPFPFYLAYAAAILRDRGFEVRVLDGVALDLSNEEFIDRVLAHPPDLFLTETAMHSWRHDSLLLRELKARLPRLRIAVAGPHATAAADFILRNEPAVDIVLRGEYEFLAAEAAQILARGAAGDLRRPGIAFREGDGIWVSPEKGFVPDLDRLPRPAVELFPADGASEMSRYDDGICTYRPAVTLHSSRGCPFRCDFCLWNQVMYDNRAYRTFPPRRVVDEMEFVIEKFGAREIYFDDDDFCVSKEHVLEICAEIRQRGLKIPWSCMGDAMVTDEEMVREMAAAGCIFMKFGVESGDREILRNIQKPLDPEKAVQVSRWCRRHGIMTHATFVLGLTGETRESMRRTLRLAHRIRFDYAQVSIATPFPGTRMHDKLVDQEIIPSTDWGSFDGTRACAFSTPELPGEEIAAFRRKFIRSLILHKIIDHGWWRNYLRRNIRLYREYGPGKVLEPLIALFRLSE